MVTGQQVRFISNSRHNDWHKGDLGEITKVLALRPTNLNDLYLVKTKKITTWCTDLDVEAFDQMPLF